VTFGTACVAAGAEPAVGGAWFAAAPCGWPAPLASWPPGDPEPEPFDVLEPGGVVDFAVVVVVVVVAAGDVVAVVVVGGGFGAGGGVAAGETVSDPVALATLPASSRAVKVTVVLPTGKRPGASFVTDTCWSTASTAPTPPSQPATAPFDAGMPPASTAVAVASRTPRSVGGVVSRTTTAKLPLALWPPPPLARQETVVCPSPKVLPLPGWHETGTAAEPWLARTSNETLAPPGPVASAVTGLDGNDSVTPPTIVHEKLWLPASGVPDELTPWTEKVCPPGPSPP
jgi:hypothetical protein